MTNPIQGTVAPVRLLGHDFSLYSGKARAYLRHKLTPFEEGVTPEDRQPIQERVGRRVIPVVVTAGGDLVQDTTQVRRLSYSTGALETSLTSARAGLN